MVPEFGDAGKCGTVFDSARLRSEELGLHFARGIQSESSFDSGVSDRTLLLRFTVAVLLALLAPATFALVYLNIAHLPAAQQNMAHVPWWSIGYFVVAASSIAALLRSRLQRQIRALGDGRPTNFAWLKRLTIE